MPSEEDGSVGGDAGNDDFVITCKMSL